MGSIVYHGTTCGYHDRQLSLLGRYEHADRRISFDDGPLTPVGYALQRAMEYQDSPLLLIIDASRVTSNLTWQPFMACDRLERDWYACLDLRPRAAILHALQSSAEPDARLEMKAMLEEIRDEAIGIGRLLVLDHSKRSL